MAGVDGARGGWVVAVVRPAGVSRRTASTAADTSATDGPGHTAATAAEVQWRTVATAAEVLAITAGCAAVAVDIP